MILYVGRDGRGKRKVLPEKKSERIRFQERQDYSRRGVETYAEVVKRGNIESKYGQVRFNGKP